MLTVFSELPKECKPIQKPEEFGVSKEHKSELGIILVSENSRDVWLVATEKIFGQMIFFSIAKQIEKKNYRIVKREKIDEALLQALYEKGVEKKNNQVDEEDSQFIVYSELMIGDALTEKVSDIHIEKRRNTAVIRMRKHGELFEYKEISPKYAAQLCTVMYNIMAENKDIVFSESDYQAAAINRIVNQQEVKLRYQSLPVYPDGFDVILRVLPIGSDDEKFVPLDRLGYSGNQVKTLLNIVSKPVGALVIAGTTGSGKSTTLKNLIMFTNANAGYKKKIYTIEDPPEYKIPKVSQIPVVRRKSEDYSKKSPFEDPLVATMRADPDILMIGEVRDKFTSDGLKKAAQSGHQVMTTVHAASALGIIERLTDFGLTASVLGSPEFLTGLCYQKLVPEICTKCSIDFREELSSASVHPESLELAKRIEVILDINKYNIRVKGKGCPNCKGGGITGRTVCSEIISPDFDMLELFRAQKNVDSYKYWRALSDDDLDSDNMTGKTALEHALSKMVKGRCSPYDIESSFGPIDNALNIVKRGNKDDKTQKPDDDWEQIK